MSENTGNENTALVPVAQMTIDEVMTVSKAMVASGYFKDATAVSQAMVKILAGREMGFGPFASMVGINIIKSKPTIGGNLMAAAVKRHPKYSYQVVVLNADLCELAFFEGKQELGRSIFTKEDAVAAETGKLVAPGASKSMLARFARNMFFNRAMSNGVKWFCPDVFLGTTVYTPEELGATVDADGEILDLKPTVIKPTGAAAATTTPNGNGTHWIDGETRNGKKVSAMFWAWATGDGEDSRGLADTEVYLALGVEHIHDFTGSMGDAKTMIDEWIARQADAQVSVETAAENGDG